MRIIATTQEAFPPKRNLLLFNPMFLDLKSREEYRSYQRSCNWGLRDTEERRPLVVSCDYVFS